MFKTVLDSPYSWIMLFVWYKYFVDMKDQGEPHVSVFSKYGENKNLRWQTHYFCAFRINSVSNGQIRGDAYSTGCMGQTGKYYSYS